MPAKRDENREVALILQNTLGTSVLYPTAVSLTNATAQHVALVDENGNQITSSNPLTVTGNINVTTDANINIDKVGGAAFSLGQQLATASLPIVLTAAQLSTLTPPAAITGYALESGNLATLAGTVSSSKVNVNISSGSIGNTSFASTVADGANVTLGTKTDAKSTATDGTSTSIVSILKEISAMVQAPASTPVTGTFWQATQPVSLASLPALAAGSNVIGHVITDSGSVVNATLAAETTKVIGTVNQGTSPWVVDTEFPAAAALGDTDANPTTVEIGALLMGWSGATWNRMFNYAPGDGANNDRGLLTNDRLQIWNSASWDRLLGAKNALNSTGTGIPTAQIVGQFDDVSPTSITENQFGNIRMSANRNVYNTIRDAAGNERGANVTAAFELQVLPTKKDAFAAATAFTITLASLANSTAGVGRQSTLITSNTAQSALILVKFTVGTSPTANTLIYVYLIRGDGSINDDNAGASDAGLTVVNAPLLGTILCSATTSNAIYYGLFDTKFLGSLGPTFGVAIVNSTGVAANATGGNFTAEYTLIT